MSLIDDTPGSSGVAGGEQFLTFLLAEQEYGVDILCVQEIKGWDTVTRIPNTPSYIRGVINLRGAIVPILDLRERFGLEAVAYSKTTVVIVLKVPTATGDRVTGIVVDAVSDVCSVRAADLQPTPDVGASTRLEFVRGIATVNERMLILLDLAHILDAQDLDPVQAAHAA